jgi:hypothetical protein
MSTATFILLIVAILAIAFGLWMYLQRERTRKLRNRFGSEYDRAVSEHGSARRAEAVLEQREKRVTRLHLRPLSLEESDRFAMEWKKVQESFVDDPRLAVARADRLVGEAMGMRGYPMGEFEQRTADISVDHPEVCENYRAAHAIALRDESGQATTEDLRKAMQHYRNLFEEILERSIGEREHAVSRQEVHR